jgi:NAD(P)-dependent dehydrogenase (short-subunit alcohol dehydrogenase family)
MNLDNIIALVTGGSKGVGYSIAESLLKLGAKMYICARNEDEVRDAIANLSPLGEIDGGVCDVRCEDQVRETLERCEQTFDGLDILVNNAGIGIFGKTVEEFSGDEFRRTLETNLYGVFYFCHYAIPMMKRRGGAFIVNISSLAGQVAQPRLAAYNASKFALNGFSESLMQELRQDDIRVSYICSDSVATGFADDKEYEQKYWELLPEHIAASVIDVVTAPEHMLTGKVEIRSSIPRP